MKKLFALLLALALCASAAFADGIDLSGMTFEELLDLQARVNDALWAADGWKHVKVPSGYYEIGVDIPAGRYTVTCANGMIFVYKSFTDAANSDGLNYSDFYMFSGKDEINVAFVEGTAIKIELSTAYFSPFVANFDFGK